MDPLRVTGNIGTSHPCFNEKAKEYFGRVHLPVAPDCNIQCGYCSRAYDCVNESRPGVTSRVLDPREAAEHLKVLLKTMPFVSVVGIAGPGDPFCNPERTLHTLELVRREHPRLHLCVSTNGLDIGPHISDLHRLGVGFVTVTVNAVSPRIGALIYTHIRRATYPVRGEEAASILLDRQEQAIRKLKEKGMAVKVNTVAILGVNDMHIGLVAERAASLGADIMNVIGVIPLPGTRFEHAERISPRLLETLRRRAGRFLPQMRHCARCRADAAGLIGGGHGQEPGERGAILPQHAEFPRITDSEATSHECATLCS